MKIELTKEEKEALNRVKQKFSDLMRSVADSLEPKLQEVRIKADEQRGKKQ